MKSWLYFFLLAPLLAQADDKHLVTETFDESTTTTENPQGKTVSWSSDMKGSIQIVDDPGLGDGKAFKGRKIVGVLPFATLTGPGDSITVQFNFRLAGPITDSVQSFKVGLYEAGDPTNPWNFGSGTGYRWNLATGQYPVQASMSRESGGANLQVLGGQDTTVMAQSSKPFALNDTLKHHATIKLWMTDSGLNLSLDIDGKFTFQSSDPLPPQTLSPGCFAIRSDANTFYFDDFSVDIKAQSNGG